MRRSPPLLAPFVVGAVVLCAVSTVWAQNPREASPAARPVPRTSSPQVYPAELVSAGRARFAANCGFCHGPEATGGSGGPDLTRSALVAADDRGNQIDAIVRTGRAEAGMPAFPAFADAELTSIVAFIHDQKTKAETATGGRRSVEVTDLQTGNARAGQRYFEATCTGCHSADGDLKGVASRLEGLALLRRMLYPGGQPGMPARRPTATVTARDGTTFSGEVAYRDEFTIALTTLAGEYRSWPTNAVRIAVSDPLQAHVDQLGRYTDATMHDVLAYLHTLR